MKICVSCKEEKPLDAYNRSNRNADKRQAYCRTCSAASSQALYKSNPKRALERNAARKLSVKQELDRIKTSTPCMDCGQCFPSVAMDFDHRDPAKKTGSVSALRSYGWSIDQILTEIAKCDLVCANCHRVRTHNRPYTRRPKAERLHK